MVIKQKIYRCVKDKNIKFVFKFLDNDTFDLWVDDYDDNEIYFERNYDSQDFENQLNELDTHYGKLEEYDDCIKNKTMNINNETKYPLPGEIYQHYKGGTYEIISMAKHSETDEIMVVYKSLNFGSVHVRPYEIFNDIVKTEEKTFQRFRFLR